MPSNWDPPNLRHCFKLINSVTAPTGFVKPTELLAGYDFGLEAAFDYHFKQADDAGLGYHQPPGPQFGLRLPMPHPRPKTDVEFGPDTGKTSDDPGKNMVTAPLGVVGTELQLR